MLKSIPNRNDIQVIIVDDGSDDCCKKELARLSHTNLEIYYQEKNLGGGFARNLGFAKVKGKWFIGCDADDFFSEDAFNILDTYTNHNIDYLCFCIKVLDGSSQKKLNHTVVSDSSVRRYLKEKNKKSISLFKFRNFEPWNKMISVDFLRKNNIQWENCRINIDVMFSLQLGLYGKNFEAIPNELYNLVFSENSITRKKKTIEREFNFYLQVVKRNTIYKALGLGYPFFRHDFLYIPFLLKKRGLKDTITFFSYRHKHINEVLEARNAYLPLLAKMEKKCLL